MSHNTLRKEKNCLNCGAQVDDRFCPHCGQENIVIHDSTWHMLGHYVQDLFHYDGRTLHTLKQLIKKPGSIAAEYIEGKRKNNIEPIKFYILSSSVFFLILFVAFKPIHQYAEDPRVEINGRIYNLEKEKFLQKNTVDTTAINSLIQRLHHQVDSINLLKGDTIEPPGLYVDIGQDFQGDTDTVSWIARAFIKKANELRTKVKGDDTALALVALDMVLHTLPQLIFLSLPFFAALLKLFYLNRRRTYAEHLIFSIYQYAYFYAFLIVFLLVWWVVLKIDISFVTTIFSWITLFSGIYFFVYLMLAMKRFYKGRKRFLFFRYFSLLTLMFFVLCFLFILVAVMKVVAEG